MSIIEQIRENSPLVHNITNYVVMNNTANALLAIGASPVMAHAVEEVEDIVSISSSLVINMGTLSEKWVEAMILAAKKAAQLEKPVVFDPVGVGASPYRSQVAKQIIKAATPTIIRGNASEIMALAQIATTTKGVDSTASAEDAVEAGIQLSKSLDTTVIISGEVDFVITQEEITKITGGSDLMPKITGMGCTATSIVGACLAVEKDAHQAGCGAMQIMAIAGSQADELSNGPGSFQMNFIDCLHALKM